MMRAYCLSDDQIMELFQCLSLVTDPEDSALAVALEEAQCWDAGLIVLSLFIARVLERYRGQAQDQARVIESLHNPNPSIWLEIQEMDHHFIKQLLLQDPGTAHTLDEILTEVARRIAVYDYE